MTKITASRLMGILKGKGEVREPGSPWKEAASPMGQHGRSNSQQAHGKNKR